MKAILKYCLIVGLISVRYAEADINKNEQLESLKPVVQTEKWAVEWWGPRHEEKVSEINRGDIDLLMIGDSR